MAEDPKDEAEPAVKPQVIDLEAEDVTAELESAPPEPAPLPQRRTVPPATWILAALAVGLIAGGWFYRDVLASYLPTNEMQTLQARIDTLEANATTASGQLLAISDAVDQARETTHSLEATIKEAAGAQSGLAARLVELEKSLQSARTDLEALRGGLTSGGTGGSADSGALAAIGQRLDALEKDVASLKAGNGTGADAELVNTLRQTLSDLRAKIAAGTAYRQELERIVRIVPAVGGNDALNSHADEGLPNAQGLAAELRNGIPTLPQPDTATSTTSGSYWDSFWDALTSVVTIRNIGEADWRRLAEDCAELAETGDLAQAITRIDQAGGELPSALSRWRDRAEARLKLEAALEELAKAVNLVIAARDGGQ